MFYVSTCIMGLWPHMYLNKSESESCINLWWLNTFTNFTFSKNHTLRKVDILPFLTVSSSLGLLIVCKFEEWERFAQLLVDKPTLLVVVDHSVQTLWGSSIS